MPAVWSPEQLSRIEASGELEIATRRPDGTLRGWVPIWVVCADAQVYVRTWHRRSSGWFGHVLEIPKARIRVPGVEADVVVEDVGEGPMALRASVDAAYRAKYGPAGAERMIEDSAAATTLRLTPE